MEELKNIVCSMKFALAMEAELVYSTEEMKRILPALEELLKEMEDTHEV